MRAIFSTWIWLLIALFLYSKLFLWLMNFGQELFHSNSRKKLENEIQLTSSIFLQNLIHSDTANVIRQLTYDYKKKEKRDRVFRDCHNLNIILKKYPLKNMSFDDISIGDFNKVSVWFYLIRKPDSVFNVERAWLRLDFYPYEFLENNTNRILDYDLVIRQNTMLFYLTPSQRDSLPFDFESYKF